MVPEDELPPGTEAVSSTNLPGLPKSPNRSSRRSIAGAVSRKTENPKT